MAVKDEVDYYQILGISRNSSVDDIKRRYQQLIKKYHPDKLPNDLCLSERTEAAELFHQIVKAHSVLSSPEEKVKYDREHNAASISQDLPLSEVLDLSAMSHDSSTRSYLSPCRCGGQYILNELDMEEGVDIVCCSTCSLCIQILYQQLENK